MQNYITASYPDRHSKTLFTPLAPNETPDALDRLCEDYSRVIGNMEKYHIEHAIVMPFNDPYMLSMDHTVKSVHKNLLSICERSNSAIFAFADIDPWLSLKETLLELEEVMKNDAFIGIKIHPTNAGYPVDGSYYMSVFQWAEMHEIPIEIHSYPREHMKDDVCTIFQDT